MLRWLLGWQMTAILVVLASAMCVAELVDAYVGGGRLPWAAFGFYTFMALFYGGMTWHRYKHPRRAAAPRAPGPDREPQP